MVKILCCHVNKSIKPSMNLPKNRFQSKYSNDRKPYAHNNSMKHVGGLYFFYFLVLSNWAKPDAKYHFLCSVIHGILVKTQYALLFPVTSETASMEQVLMTVKTQYALLFPVTSETASMEQVLMTVPFDYAVTDPSVTGDFHLHVSVLQVWRLYSLC